MGKQEQRTVKSYKGEHFCKGEVANDFQQNQ